MAQRIDKNTREEIKDALTQADIRRQLFAAVRTGDCDMLKNLLATPYVDINTANIQGQTALHIAAGDNQAKIVDILIHHGAILDARDKSQTTPLYQAAMKNSNQAAQSLIKAGANPNLLSGNGMSPLHCAIVMDNGPLTAMLLDAGADFELKTQNGQTCMQLAMTYDHVQQIKILLEHRAMANAACIKRAHRYRYNRKSRHNRQRRAPHNPRSPRP